MQIPDPITRVYKLTDAEMLEAARVTHGYFMEDKADFLAFDPTLVDPFADNFLMSIDAIELFPSNDQLLDQQVQKTLTVEDAMKQGRNGYQTLKYFIERAFPQKIAIWNEFGYNDYERVRSTQPAFIQFLIQLHQTALKYKTELNSVGYDIGRIDSIAQWAKDLQQSNTTQEMFKGNRPVSTQKRVEQLNNVWEIIRRIRRVGKLVYMDNFARQQRYLSKSTAAGSKPLTGEVAPSSVSNVLSGGFNAETAFNLHNTGDTLLRFALGKNGSEVPDASGITLNPGAEQNVTAAQLGEFDDQHTFINVLNLSGEAKGNFEVNLLE